MLVRYLFSLSPKASLPKSALWSSGWVCTTLPDAFFYDSDSWTHLRVIRIYGKRRNPVSSLSQHHTREHSFQLLLSLLAAAMAWLSEVLTSLSHISWLFWVSDVRSKHQQCCGLFRNLSTSYVICFWDITWHDDQFLWSISAVCGPTLSVLFSQPRSGNSFLQLIISRLYQDCLFHLLTVLNV